MLDALSEAGLGVATLVAANGVDGYNMLVRREPYRDLPLPALIILDINLPAIDGRSMLKTLKSEARWRGIPVVVFSSSPAHRVECLAVGAVDYVVKPMVYDAYVAFARTLQRHLGGQAADFAARR